jgi:hypothetical protein
MCLPNSQPPTTTPLAMNWTAAFQFAVCCDVLRGLRGCIAAH